MSSRNALKHGILAKTVVLHSEESGETQEEFDVLLASLRDDLLPVGALEEMLVEKIAICHWRLRRVLRSEAGNVDENLGMLAARTYLQQITECHGNCYLQFTNMILRFRGETDLQALLKLDEQDFEVRQRLRNTSIGLRTLGSQLSAIKRTFEEQDYLNHDHLKLFVQYFGPEEAFFNKFLVLNDEIKQLVLTKSKSEEQEGPQDEKIRALKAQILGLITKQMELWEGLQGIFEFIEKEQLETKKRALALPDKDAMDRILRYESSIDRGLYRAIHQLERMQRMRKGEFVAPPASVSVS